MAVRLSPVPVCIADDDLAVDRAVPAGVERLRMRISGAVQGVGFRPFVYRLATELELGGWVSNDAHGVILEIEGDPAALATFRARLSDSLPPQAAIHALTVEACAPVGETVFVIRASMLQGDKTTLVLPDLATCPACLAEILDPTDRRYGYAFGNCTNCGPRFSIVRDLPYDRPNTAMRDFALCPACSAEYGDPRDRRFHAQPTACPLCGPQLAWWPAAGTSTDAADPLTAAVAAICDGQIVAVKGLGGFQLLADATNPAAVARLRERKPRRAKPFALMVRDLAQAATLCDVPPAAAELLSSAAAPIVLLPRRPDVPLAANVAPGNPYLGLMLPTTPLHHLLLRALARPVVATSGNLSEEPICIDEQAARARLGHVADSFLVHNRPIVRHADDSVVSLIHGAPCLLRRARGYAPLPVLLDQPAPCILAVGAHLKNTVALTVGAAERTPVFISQHIGDLGSAEATGAFEQVIGDLLRLYAATPAVIAHDLHPDYFSSQYAQELARAQEKPPRLVGVQHHHAHLAACLADNQARGPALGAIWDGAGYGLDGTVWGGEFLYGDLAGSQRVAHLLPLRLPGGDAAAREPRRAGLALLWELYGAAALERDDLAPVRAFRPAERNLLGQMLTRGVNTPLTTSAGRLFDGVAALLGLQQHNDYEGQAAMALEFAADPTVSDAYPFELIAGAQPAPFQLDWRPALAALLADLVAGRPVATIAARFQNSLVAALVAVAQVIGASQVALSGGCFQNRLLAERAATQLRGAGFAVLLQRQVPPNDGGISLGQLACAAARLQQE